MSIESAKEKIKTLLEKRGFVEQKEGLFIINTGASKVGVELFGERPIIGVIINNKLEEEGHGIQAVFELRSQVLGIWDREINRGTSEQKEQPAPKPEPKKQPEETKQKRDENMEEEKALTVIAEPPTSGFLTPATTIEDAVAVFDMFEQAKTKLLKDSDILWIGANGRPASKGIGHPHIKRSGWRKLARFFGINCSIIDKEKLTSKDSEGEFYLWKFRVRAQHPKGDFFEAEGVCSSRDPFFSKKGGIRVDPDEADIMMKAQTVAFNRATSDLLGSGEVSADEIKSEDAKA